ncbi:MAG: hypothetical protein HQ582_03855 [Planctomycetes bacterium]|nr:hypothetical protein [Planctomycetota bacterium]
MLRNPKRMERCIAIAVAIGLFCSAETLAKKPPEEPTAAELNPAIAYVQSSNKGSDVVVAAADLQSQVVLTESVRNTKVSRGFGSPAWSADGQFVAFWSQDSMGDGMVTPMKLYVAKADASQVTLVRDFTTWPGPDFFISGLNWSPSGKELIYSLDSAASIIAIDAVTGDTSVLLAGQYFDPTGHAALSPDLDDAPGYQGFLAARGFDGSWTPGAETYWDIFMVPVSDDADGYLLPVDPTLFVDVTNKPGSDQFHPSWSPDGATIACFDDKSLAVYDVATGQSWTIAPNYQTGVSAQDRPAWTSDGWGLVFQSSDIGVGDLAISVALENSPPINYTATRRLTEKAPAWNPMWNPDGPGGF